MLLDTGPLVGVLDSRDQWHAVVRDAWPSLVGRCVTTEAVLTETCHLIGRGGGHPALPLEFVLGAGVPVVALDTPALRQVALLMRRYERVPMDYADATLVAVADVLGITCAFTTDRKGFRAYRGARGTAFELVPA